MSEFLAEASVLVRPDVTKFRAQLQAQLLAATRGITVPVPVVAAPVATGRVSGLAAASGLAAREQQNLGIQAERTVQSLRNQQREVAKSVVSMKQLEKGAAATGLSLFGIRGATLAATGSFLAGAAAVTVFAKAVGIAASFEKELNVFRVTATATADEMDRVAEASRQLGADVSLPAVSAADAAQAMTELAKAGLTVEDSISGARGVLQLATAAELDNAVATNIVASALNAFGLAGEQAVEVADRLANAANEAQGGIGDMGGALASVASVSRQVGISLRDTVALLTLLAKNGIQGASAGTVLRVALLRLVAPSGEAAEIIQKLGLRIRDAQGNIRPEVFSDFAKATADLGAKTRDANAAIVFGTRGVRAQAVLGREGAAGLNAMRDATDRAGAAAEIAGARTQGFLGQLDALKSGLETLGIALGSVALGPLSTFIKTVSDGIGFVNQFADALKKLSRVEIKPIKITGDLSLSTDVDPEREGRDLGGLFRQGLEAALAPQLALFTVRDAAKNLKDTFTVDFQEKVNKLTESFEEQGSILKDNEGFIKTIIQRLGGVPSEQQIRFLVNAEDVSKALEKLVNNAREKGTLSAEALAENFRRESQAVAGSLTVPLQRGLSDFVTAAGKAGEEAAKAITVGFAANLDLELAVAKAQGAGDQGILSILRQQEAGQAEFLERVLGFEDTAANRKLAEKAAANLERTRNEIQSILDRQAADAKSAKNDIVQARREADQAILDSLDLTESARRTAVIEASSTKGLQDDVRRNNALRRFFINKRDQIRKTIQDAKLKAQEIAKATADLARVENVIADLEEQQAEALRDRARERRERARESLGLDIQIAESTGNRAAEIRARQAEIDFIEAQIRQTRRNSLQRKRLIAELRAAQAELRDLTNEKKKTNDALSALQFEFLQTQQGFAANLLSNLIPSEAAAGTVGNISAPSLPPLPSPGAAIGAVAGVEAARDQGPTRSDAAATIHELRAIRGLLAGILAGTGHPEARFQKRQSGGSFDTM